MSREKQIEKNEFQEFVITLSNCQHRYDKECTKAIVTKTDMPKANKFYAKYLMEHGYRKQSEVAREIFEQIEKVAFIYYIDKETNKSYQAVELAFIAELKKKYTEGNNG